MAAGCEIASCDGFAAPGMGPQIAYRVQMTSGSPDSGLALSVVEQSPVRRGGSGAEALRESVELAVAVEAMGYERFWVAEHHSLPSIASTSPEILIGQVAARTHTMRVGSGGVMLPHYSALKVAENFRMLESFYPGRIDLGLGRAPGGDPRTAAAMVHPASPIDVRHYPDQVDDLIGYLSGGLAADHAFAGIVAGPEPAAEDPGRPTTGCRPGTSGRPSGPDDGA